MEGVDQGSDPSEGAPPTSGNDEASDHGRSVPLDLPAAQRSSWNGLTKKADQYTEKYNKEAYTVHYDRLASSSSNPRQAPELRSGPVIILAMVPTQLGKNAEVHIAGGDNVSAEARENIMAGVGNVVKMVQHGREMREVGVPSCP